MSDAHLLTLVLVATLHYEKRFSMYIVHSSSCAPCLLIIPWFEQNHKHVTHPLCAAVLTYLVGTQEGGVPMCLSKRCRQCVCIASRTAILHRSLHRSAHLDERERKHTRKLIDLICTNDLKIAFPGATSTRRYSSVQYGWEPVIIPRLDYNYVIAIFGRSGKRRVGIRFLLVFFCPVRRAVASSKQTAAR
eukprot:6179555-Pleurochrysis_carterae.AAC.2